ncbi:hypothetical protein ATN83_3024 [Raoultella ornithinolytica]|nr:hypothetical protein ATN83_3024 [Raoultella ornithinolytica]KDV93819.1 hypothetical protein AB00_1963 [Raoultella ornithinolytica 2-156-04_S1_C1]KDX14049.1 hypothetical protein AB28_2152 [Raoultella ornithinolytica 2-156-04_S1_C2]
MFAVSPDRQHISNFFTVLSSMEYRNYLIPLPAEKMRGPSILSDKFIRAAR